MIESNALSLIVWLGLSLLGVLTFSRFTSGKARRGYFWPFLYNPFKYDFRLSQRFNIHYYLIMAALGATAGFLNHAYADDTDTDLYTWTVVLTAISLASFCWWLYTIYCHHTKWTTFQFVYFLCWLAISIGALVVIIISGIRNDDTEAWVALGLYCGYMLMFIYPLFLSIQLFISEWSEAEIIPREDLPLHEKGAWGEHTHFAHYPKKSYLSTGIPSSQTYGSSVLFF